MSIVERFRAEWRHAFAIESADDECSDAEREMVERLADFIVRRGLSAPALMALEAGRPLNFIGSQLLVFLTPFATLVFSRKEYGRFVNLLERRHSIDLIVDAIAKRESEMQRDG